jgi:hypothetical protein
MSRRIVRFLPVVAVLAIAAGWYAPLPLSGQQVPNLQHLNTGTLKFEVPHGDTPDAVRNHPILKGLNVPDIPATSEP